MARRPKRKSRKGIATKGPARRVRDWSKIPAPGKGDIDRKDYERSKVYRERQAAARRGQETREARQRDFAYQQGIELQKVWESLLQTRGDRAQLEYKRDFLPLKESMQSGLTKHIFEETMRRIGRRMHLPRSLWRRY